jgi:hypothetical protein
MPIKGITDGQRYMSRLGKIHLGIKMFRDKNDMKGHPMQTEYFICPDEVKAVYGLAPRKLTVQFLSNDLNVVMPHWFKLYGASTIAPVCKGDGIAAMRLDMRTGTRVEVGCPGPRDCKFNQYIDKSGEIKAKGCMPTVNLMINLPDVPGFGTYQIDTKSWNGLRELLDDVAMIKAALNGRLAFVPLTLSLMERDVDHMDPVRGMGKKHIRYMHLSYEGTIRDLAKLPASLVPALRPGEDGETVAIPEPDESKPDDMVDDLAEPEAAQETPKTFGVPVKRDQLAAIEQLASEKTSEEFAALHIQSINVHDDPPVITVDGRTFPIDADYAALLIRELQDGYVAADLDDAAKAFAQKFE